MGFVIAIVYLVTAYLGPATLFGPLAAAHIGLILAALVFLVSLPALQGSLIWKTPQSLALIALAFVTFLSVLLTGWAGGAMQAFLDFIPNAFAYFVVCLHCNSMKKLRILVLVMLLVCLFVIAHGYYDLQHQSLASAVPGQAPEETPYLLPQQSDDSTWFYRIRGQDFINDPNDFAQVIVCIVPLMFIFWRPKKFFRNVAFVALPVCVLLFGAYLTHSRGSLLAVLAIIVVAARRRIGTVPSLLAAAGLFAAAMALHVTGGRGISADSGAGRMDLWAGGLEAMKSHPFFGVGFNNLGNYIGMTAHNSVVVCAAELGVIGLYFWSMFLFPTLRDALAIASPARLVDGAPIAAGKTGFAPPIKELEEIDKAEINNIGHLAVMSLTGFLVASWFLSRAFTMTLFLLGGIVEVVFEMAQRRGMIAPRLRFDRLSLYVGVFTISLLVLTYLVLRVGNLMR